MHDDAIQGERAAEHHRDQNPERSRAKCVLDSDPTGRLPLVRGGGLTTRSRTKRATIGTPATRLMRRASGMRFATRAGVECGRQRRMNDGANRRARHHHRQRGPTLSIEPAGDRAGIDDGGCSRCGETNQREHPVEVPEVGCQDRQRRERGGGDQQGRSHRSASARNDRTVYPRVAQTAPRRESCCRTRRRRSPAASHIPRTWV